MTDFLSRLKASIDRAGSPLCLGLDPDPAKIPAKFGGGIVGAQKFLEEIIIATWQKVAAFKPNTAFFEAYGSGGWLMLERLRFDCPPDVVWLVDAKRGDIEHTNEFYAKAIFDVLGADAVTVQPYLGMAALEPFWRHKDKGVFVLCATSNASASLIQQLDTGERLLYQEVAHQVKAANLNGNMGLVVGTTKPEALESVLSIAPELPLLMPGSGAQGGSMDVLKKVQAANGTALINVSRSVLYASNGNDCIDAAVTEVEKLRKSMA
ncbi:MAG: orotidine-5'-phosphate decarboxylase [Calditrichaeota bacterium]|nr:orotidine-5'-phosphate decarboxylase [Calditrichota bacterium]MCB9369548.1 orotidine-5'-phosphate decarboxylase [Calditrichota bacterium]